MPECHQTLFQIINHIINQYPFLAADVEKIAANAQGKGYGAATIEKEILYCHQFLNYQTKLAVDIGGNVGDYTAELRRTNPQLEIHIFEPASVNVVKLNFRFKSDELVKIVPLAVSDKASSEAILFSDEFGSGLASLTHRKLDHFNILFNATESVETVLFEDYWKNKLQSRNIDIIKIDIEGHELAALNGFGDALNAVKVIQFEFGGCNIDTRTYFQDFWYFFKERHFAIYRITPFGPEKLTRYKESDEFFSTTNYIAVSERE